MARWITQDIASRLMNALGPLAVKIENIGPGGDVDTENLLIDIQHSPGYEDKRFWVCGFDVKNDPADPADCEVEFVQLTDGDDSRGGLNSNSPNMALAYVKIREELQGLGFDVVDSMDEYF